MATKFYYCCKAPLSASLLARFVNVGHYYKAQKYLHNLAI